MTETKQYIKTQVDLENKNLEATINKATNEQLKKLQEIMLKEVNKMINNALTSQMNLINTNTTKEYCR